LYFNDRLDAMTNDKEFMKEIKEGLKQAKSGKGVPIEKILQDLEKGFSPGSS
jgi:predicted transcriptional regulator